MFHAPEGKDDSLSLSNVVNDKSNSFSVHLSVDVTKRALEELSFHFRLNSKPWGFTIGLLEFALEEVEVCVRISHPFSDPR